MADQTQTAQLDVLVNGEQATQELKDLSAYARDLAKQIDEARNAGKNALAGQLSKELKETNNKIKGLRGEVTDLSKILNNLSAAKPIQLRKALTALEAKLNSRHIERGSAQWRYYQESIRRVREELRLISEESAVTQSWFARLSDAFNRFAAPIMAVIASITGLSLLFRGLSEEAAEMDGIYSDVMKTTSTTREEVKEINEEFKKIDTRTARKELNKIAEEGGRIGVLKEEILEFTKTMDILNVALGDSFKGGAEEIAGVLGKLKFLFEETKNMQIEKAYLSIGAAINDLGANGVSTEANIANFATRLGSLPASLKPPLASTLALGAAFEEAGIEAEIASRAYNIAIRQAATQAAKFATVMRISTGEVEALINKDPLEFFLKFAQGMKGMDATDVAKTLSFLGISADGANKVVSAAADNMARFRELIQLSNQSFREGTSALNEFGIKNNDMAAKLQKAKNSFWEASQQLAERLNPVLLKSVNLTSYMVRLLPDVIDWFSKYGTLIIKITAVIAAYLIGIKAAVLWEKLFGTEIARNNTLLMIKAVQLKIAALWTKTLRAATLLYAAAMHLMHGRITMVIKALRLFALTLAMNPIGAAVAAIAALTIAIYTLIKGYDKANQYMKSQIEINKKVDEEYGKQEAQINNLINTLKNEKISLDARKKALLELRSIIPGYHAELTKEGNLINNNTDAIKEYLKYREKEIRLNATKEELDALYELKRKQQREHELKYDPETGRPQIGARRAQRKLQQTLDAIKKTEKEVQEAAQELEKTTVTVATEIDEEKNYLVPSEAQENTALKKALQKEEERYSQEKANLKKRYSEKLEDEESFNRKMEEIETQHLQKEKEITEQHGQNSAEIQEKIYDRIIKRAEDEKNILEKLEETYDSFDLKAADRDKMELIRIAQKFDAAKKILSDAQNRRLISEEQYHDLLSQLNDKRLEAEKKAIRDRGALLAAAEMKRIDTQKAQEEAALAQQHRQGLITEGAYKEELLKLEENFLRKKLLLTGLSEEQINEVTKKLSANKADRQDLQKKERDDVHQQYNIGSEKELREKEYQIIEDYEARGVLTHEEALKAKILADENYLKELSGKLGEANAKIQNITSSLTTAMDGFMQAEEKAVSLKYDKQIAAAQGNAAKQKKLEEKKEKELAAIRAKYADKQFIVKIASIGAATALAAMEAYAAMSSIPIAGPALGAIAAAAAIATGAAQIAAAKQERDSAREGYSRGGYTPSGPWNETQGVVHSGEFVANRFATQNPVLRKVFDVIDQAQRNNTVAALSERDFTRALEYREAGNNAIAETITRALIPSTAEGQSLTEETTHILIRWIQHHAQVTQQLNERLDEPFTGEVYIDGPRGVKKNMDKYNRLVNNASR
jgi:TP901 family phage tail tape measure protein